MSTLRYQCLRLHAIWIAITWCHIVLEYCIQTGWQTASQGFLFTQKIKAAQSLCVLSYFAASCTMLCHSISEKT